jgi:hypothetical protein
LPESDANPIPQNPPNKYTCEDATFGGQVCGMPAYYMASYDGGDSVPLCLPHIMLELEASRLDPVHQQQEWVITYV